MAMPPNGHATSAASRAADSTIHFPFRKLRNQLAKSAQRKPCLIELLAGMSVKVTGLQNPKGLSGGPPV